MSMNFGIAEYWYDLYDFLLENTLQLHWEHRQSLFELFGASHVRRTAGSANSQRLALAN